MRFLAPTIVILGMMGGQEPSPAAAFAFPDHLIGRAKEVPLSDLSAVSTPLRLAATAYKAPSTDGVTPAPGAATTPATTPTPPTAPAATTTTTPATIPAAKAGTDSSGGAPAATSTADGAAGTDAAPAPAPVAPNPDVYKPPSVEVAPGGITIYRGSGAP